MSGEKQFATFVFAERAFSFDLLCEPVKNLQPGPDEREFYSDIKVASNRFAPS